MRVNSPFISLFNNRTITSSCVAIMLSAVFFTASSFKEHPDPVYRSKQVNLIIRQIGHQLLLQAGDSTSRVLPVVEIKEGTFVLKFENQLVFSHDSLMMLAQGLLPKKQFPSGYTVTVLDCIKHEIVYGFQVNSSAPDILACGGRKQPINCYTIEFDFPDFYETVKQDKAGIDQQTKEIKSVNIDRQEGKSKLAELKPTGFSGEMREPSTELESVDAIPQEVDSKKATISGYAYNNMIYAGILILLVAAFFIWRSRKNLTALPAPDLQQTSIKESVQEFDSLGRFSFNVKGQRLLLGNEVISLTDKECKVLELLHKNFGELIPREMLLQKVWIDEGVITGRSLDMFVSKLRKKLSGDPDLRITNVHGKGYKLEIS